MRKLNQKQLDDLIQRYNAQQDAIRRRQKKAGIDINHPNAIDPEYGITNAQLKRLQDALDNCDYTKPAKCGSTIDTLGKKVFKHVRYKNKK
jgi:protein tyrosine phosphatase (PTP) superfamily phosphohydrolase (DUF442 family)